jgi:hypothetical protein
MLVENCEFTASADYAIYGADFTASMMDSIIIDRCKFDHCASVLRSTWDTAVVQNSLVYTASPTTSFYTAFYNRGGTLHLRGMIGVPSGVWSANSQPARWIQNDNGNVFVSGCRFGGEDSGWPIVFHSGGFQTTPGSPIRWLGSSIVIRDSAVFMGGPSSTGIYSSVIFIASGCPQRVIVEGTTGPIGGGTATIINTWNQYNLDQYLFGFVGTGDDAAIKSINISIDSNLQPMRDGAVCVSLLRYLNQFESSIFPVGAQYGTSPVATGNVSQASFTYYIPTTVMGFVAMVTISVTPVPGQPYRTAATYLLAMTLGYDGSQGPIDILTVQSPPLFAPPPSPYAAPTIVSALFSNGKATQKHGANDWFTITWDSGYANLQVWYPTITLQPIHVIT